MNNLAASSIPEPLTIEPTKLNSSIIAGPVVRHCDVSQLNFWLVTTQAYDFTFKLYRNNNEEELKKIESVSEHSHQLLFKTKLSASKTDLSKTESTSTNTNKKVNTSQLQQIQIGESAFINLITILAEDHCSESVFPENTLLSYDIITSIHNGKTESITELSHLLYPDQKLPNLVIKPNIENLLHGSCRKPHYKSEDGLKQVDCVLQASDVDNRPSMLIMSGDQIYADDVAGPTLNAIHQVIDMLGLYNEEFELDAELNKSQVTNSQSLFKHQHCYYQRQHLLPTHTQHTLFGEKTQPIFTSVHVNNHLITLSEVIAMYLLTWSPELWEKVKLATPPPNLSQALQAVYKKELEVITDFHQGLYEVRRAMAHIPVYMIFDDHDITDDWNLTRGWEEAAYTNPFAKQIIGNALIGYWLCQGWGNAPDKFTDLLTNQTQYFNSKEREHKTELIDALFDFEQWNYNLNTTPKIVVLDTRTQRWRSESNENKPSGLMDWETLSDFQQELIKEPSVIVVSPAPIYGVKLIETIQRIFTLCGKPLAVDAENWMAHSGTANVILNIFRNPKTPPNFIILSGDVHYSFVYEVTHRFRKNSAKIIQVTCSGIKNTFPDILLTVLEKLNKVLYSTYSPLNWFTKRRRMKIRVRKPNTETNRHLFNGSGIGVLRLNKENDEVITEFITSQGRTIEFIEYDSDED